jgi:hypothetical protein
MPPLPAGTRGWSTSKGIGMYIGIGALILIIIIVALLL